MRYGNRLTYYVKSSTLFSSMWMYCLHSAYFFKGFTFKMLMLFSYYLSKHFNLSIY